MFFANKMIVICAGVFIFVKGDALARQQRQVDNVVILMNILCFYLVNSLTRPLVN